MSLAPSDRLLAPKQARSQATLDRMLDAAEELLTEREFGDITVSDIVERADRTIGAFYARFTDKDAVLLALVERGWSRDLASLQRHLAPVHWADRSVDEVLHAGLALMSAAYRRPRPPLKAMLLRAAHDEEFRARRAEMIGEILAVWRRLILSKRAEIGHSDPVTAVNQGFRHALAVFDHLLLFGPYWPNDAVDDDVLDDLFDFQRRLLRIGDHR